MKNPIRVIRRFLLRRQREKFAQQFILARAHLYEIDGSEEGDHDLDKHFLEDTLAASVAFDKIREYVEGWD